MLLSLLMSLVVLDHGLPNEQLLLLLLAGLVEITITLHSS